jgi:TDG/mug DNA glycosylase family protein
MDFTTDRMQPPDFKHPTRDELERARAKVLKDVIGPNLRVLFCGINPGLYSAAVGHHFARPGNRFWPTLHAAGFTPRLISPFEERIVLEFGYGLTNLVDRATASATELSDEEFQAGAVKLLRKIKRYEPRFVAFVGMGAYRIAFHHPKAALGPQPDPLGPAIPWVLPSPSGLNASYQPKRLKELFSELRCAVEKM